MLLQNPLTHLQNPLMRLQRSLMRLQNPLMRLKNSLTRLQKIHLYQSLKILGVSHLLVHHGLQNKNLNPA